MRGRTAEAGFSVVELLVACALTTMAMAGTFQLLEPANGIFRTAPERADVQHRARSAVVLLADAIGRAGAGACMGPAAGSLVEHIAPVLPFRIGRRNPIPKGTSRADAITLLSVPLGARQTTLSQPPGGAERASDDDLAANCPQSDPLHAGFEPGMTVLAIGAHGRFDLFQRHSGGWSSAHFYGTTHAIRLTPIRPGQAGRSGKPSRRSRSGWTRRRTRRNWCATTATAEEMCRPSITSWRFLFPLLWRFCTPSPMKPPGSADGPWATYGLRPPLAAEQPTLYAPGENCAFQLDGAGLAAPRLPALGVY